MDALVFVAIVAITSLSDVRIRAVPLNVLDPVDVSNSVADEGAVEDGIVDDFTTHGLERLSSAATCLVAGVEYTHGQQIYRSDPCEFCLCLDGEMFCWWQDCPPTMEGPCKDRGPFTPCLNIPASSSTPTHSKSTTPEHLAWTDAEVENATDTSTYTDDDVTEEPVATTQSNSKFCVIMGRKYQVGDKLPHDTGNCVECVCGLGAKVTCSPHQCAPAGEDINDYRPPGPRQQLPDVF